MKSGSKLLLIAALICLAAWGVAATAGGDQPAPAAGVAAPAQPAQGQPAGERSVAPGQHGDPYAFLFQVLAIVLLTAAVGHYVAAKLNQSSVLGEIVVGIIVGALFYQFGGPTVTIIRNYERVQEVNRAVLTEGLSWDGAARQVLKNADLPEKDARQLEQVLLREDVGQFNLAAGALQLFSSLGVVLLLFLVGLECQVQEMRAVGWRSFGVAAIGMAGIFAGAYLALKFYFLNGGKPLTPVFLAAALTATSISITARVFKDMNRLSMGEAKVVLGAAVLDDVLGLIVLAVVTGMAAGGVVHPAAVAVILLKAVGFLVGVLLLGAVVIPRLVVLFATLDRGNVRLIFPFAFLMLVAWLADQFGLATIIGAFAAGLILEEEYFPPVILGHYEGRTVEAIMAPIQALFAPIFFVLIGLRVDIATFANLKVLFMCGALVVIILACKLASALPVKKGDNRLVVAAGMLPRGEVSLIFASLGKSLGLLNDNLYSAIIVVVLLTTLLTPPFLKLALERGPH